MRIRLCPRLVPFGLGTTLRSPPSSAARKSSRNATGQDPNVGCSRSAPPHRPGWRRGKADVPAAALSFFTRSRWEEKECRQRRSRWLCTKPGGPVKPCKNPSERAGIARQAVRKNQQAEIAEPRGSPLALIARGAHCGAGRAITWSSSRLPATTFKALASPPPIRVARPPAGSRPAGSRRTGSRRAVIPMHPLPRGRGGAEG